MPKFQTQRRVGHSAAQMFDLVADIEAYPQFVPLCTALRVRDRRCDEAGRDVLVADMEVGYKAIREKFSSRVLMDKAALQITVDYLDGPFSRMHNVWSFAAAEGVSAQSDVKFFIDYEFRSRMLGLLMGSMFDTAFRRFTAAFEARADKIYGRSA